MTLLAQIKKRYERDGVIPLFQYFPTFVYNRIKVKRDEWKGSNFNYQLIKQDGVEERWKLIEPYLDEDKSVLDVGCNAGLFTKRAAGENRFSIGIEKNSQTVRDAVKYHGESRNFGIVNKVVSKEVVSSFPVFDYVFLFSVYHHIYRIDGKSDAESILRQLAKKTSDTLFFEPASRTEWYGEEDIGFEDNNTESIIEYNTAMLEDVIDQEIEVEYLDSRTEGTDEKRCLFAIHMK